MKLINFFAENEQHLGLFHNNRVISLQSVTVHQGKDFPKSMEQFLNNLDQFEATAREIDRNFKDGAYDKLVYDMEEIDQVFAPVPRPTSCRDAYAFRQHVATARRNRGVEMIPEFDQFPVWYFTNHNAIYGPGPIPVMADHLHKLDFELEAAIVVGRRGRNLRAEEADHHIFGYMIMNDLSARQLQMEEMRLNLGPAKGKDFASAIGPLLVTADELEPHRIPAPEGHVGNQYKLEMTCRVNGREVSRGNLGSMDWTFAEILERVSYGSDILPGDVIGSGTVGTGCFLELNGTGKLNDENYQPQWLQLGDTVELEIDELGVLSNTIQHEDDFSILARKKNVAEEAGK